MNEIPVQTIVFKVNDKIDARELCEILAMNGYMAKAKSDDDSITGGWLVFVEVGYPKHIQTAKSVYGNYSDDARVAELEAEVEELKPYRDGYDANEHFPEDRENVIANLGNWRFVANYRNGKWYDLLGAQAEIRGGVDRWWKLPEVEE